MASLKIQVLGRGMIPRGYGLAPRKNPFSADYYLIATILSTPGLSVKYINPETGVPTDLTKSSLKRVWDKYSSYVAPVKVADPDVTVPISPVVPDKDVKPATETPVNPTPVATPEVKVDELKPVVNDEKKDETPEAKVEDMKPVVNEDTQKSSNQTQNNNNQNKNNQNNSNKNNQNNNQNKNNSNKNN